ncbi:MAG: hypothetical protein ACPG7C_06735 [Ilumatobacteraceae bacterium]|jgi:hypothetical protein
MRSTNVEVVEAIADMAWATVSSLEKSTDTWAISSVRIPMSTTDALTDVIKAKYCSIGR